MADNVAEKKVLIPEPQPAPAPAETFSVPETEAGEKIPEAEQVTREQSAPAETPRALPDLLHLKRRPKHVVVPQVRDELTVKIEKIMEEGVGEPYQRLSPVAKQEFKLKGEQTARAIRELLKSGHVKVKKILRLIIEWLKMLPGINRFFMEQEAKIKTDKIIALQKQSENVK